jgi:GNAT superfamily N-acetyltransferase
MGRAQGDRILSHLLALEPHDRYLRFGYSANDEQIGRYVDQLNFERDELFGIFNRQLELIAMAHLAFSVDPSCTSCAEFGVSVSKAARGRGYGSRLFERAVMHARNEGVTLLFIHALSENTAMLRIARKAGAVIERDGSESEAHLRLPPADFDSRLTEIIDEQLAQTNYQLKAQAKHFRDALALLQEIRQGVRDARDRMK